MRFYQQSPRAGVICNYGITDHFKTDHLSVDFVMPLTLENAVGISLLSAVMSRGCKAYPRMDLISQYLSKNYGAAFSIQSSKAGEMELLSFAFSYLDNGYAIDGEDIRGAILSLFREMIYHPLVKDEAFLEEYVEQEKINLADKITGLFNDKRVYSMERCKELMFADEAYGISDMGTKEAIAAMDAAALYRFFRKMMDEAYVIITHVGKDHGVFLNDLADGFADRTTVMPETEIRNSVARINEVVDPMELSQSKLNLGFRLGQAAFENGAACRLFNVLYGGSATSKLFMNVRERLSLCYYCSSNIDRFKNIMLVSSGIEADKYEEARREIEAQLAAVAAGDFTDEELENARVYMIDSLRGALDSESALASMMAAGTLRGDVKTIEQEIEAIRCVSREEIVAVASEVQLDTVYFLKGVHNEA